MRQNSQSISIYEKITELKKTDFELTKNCIVVGLQYEPTQHESEASQTMKNCSSKPMKPATT